ncbi:hypothetical protein PVAP13_3KG367700 [Panicum virgatum]|uniref:Secreted protein n=1 Tax=Panicum virgatum TaxID=38727 RepID=A0A8T0UQ42_PANVG|nr:hypothetical protein PVAP13_3KG367700 [Panicum virgatum]
MSFALSFTWLALSFFLKLPREALATLCLFGLVLVRSISNTGGRQCFLSIPMVSVLGGSNMSATMSCRGPIHVSAVFILVVLFVSSPAQSRHRLELPLAASSEGDDAMAVNSTSTALALDDVAGKFEVIFCIEKSV